MDIKSQTKQIAFSYQALAEMMVKEAGIHEGYWSVFVRFGINAANVGLNNAPPVPTAIVPMVEIGITREDEQGPLAIDAAKVNPEPQSRRTAASKTKKNQR